MTTTHDEMAYAVAVEAIGAIRSNVPPWNTVFSDNCHITTSRSWPVPDFVVLDAANEISAAVEFKPPGQSKREYLTGLGQALAYTKDFDYGLLVVPSFADDSYPIAEHIKAVLDQQDYLNAPVGLLRYDPSAFSIAHAGAEVVRFFQHRGSPPEHKARIDVSFYAKWREISAEETARFLRYLYQEQTEPSSHEGTVRDRAWKKIWKDIQRGVLHNWQGQVRHFANVPKSYEGNMKNWRNFLNHIGWIETDGRLTDEGLEAHRVALVYGAKSQMFRNLMARATLIEGKHLILINHINEYQDVHLRDEGPFDDEGIWLDGIEHHLETLGLLKRNPGRADAAVRNQQRGFLKAEKQLWKELGFVTSRGRRVFHKGRGFIFDWTRVTELIRQS